MEKGEGIFVDSLVCMTDEISDQPECIFVNLIIDGVHNKNRNFKIDLPDLPCSKLEVLGGLTEKTAAKLKIEYQGACNLGASDCPAVTIKVVDGKQWQETYTAAVKEISVVSGDPDGSNSFLEKRMPFFFFISNIIFPTETTKQVYNISPRICGGYRPFDVTVAVYTPVSWGGNINWAIKRDKKDNMSIEMGGNVSASYADKTFKLDFKPNKRGIQGGGILSTLFGIGEKTYNAMEGFQALTSNKRMRLTSKLETLGETPGSAKSMVPKPKFTIHYPKLDISGKVSNVEIPGKYMIGTEGSIRFAFSPLLGADISVDILDLLAALSPLILRIKKIAEEGIDTEMGGASASITAMLGFGCDIPIGFEVKYNVYNWSVEGDFKFFPHLIIKAEAKAEGRIWNIAAGAGANISIQSAENKSDNPGVYAQGKFIKANEKDIELQGKIIFTGAKVYSAYYSYIGTKEVVANENYEENVGRGKRAKSKVKSNEQTKYGSEESKVLCDIFPSEQIYP